MTNHRTIIEEEMRPGADQTWSHYMAGQAWGGDCLTYPAIIFSCPCVPKQPPSSNQSRHRLFPSCRTWLSLHNQPFFLMDSVFGKRFSTAVGDVPPLVLFTSVSAILRIIVLQSSEFSLLSILPSFANLFLWFLGYFISFTSDEFSARLFPSFAQPALLG